MVGYSVNGKGNLYVDLGVFLFVFFICIYFISYILYFQQQRRPYTVVIC